MDGSIGGKLTPPQFIRAGVFMCRHIHREGNGGLFLFRCTAGSTVATCVHRIGHMAHSTQLTISAMHAHIKATESIILILSLGTDSGTLLPRTHTHTHTIARAAVTRSPTQRGRTRCSTPTGKEIRGARSLSPSSSWPRKKTTAATRNCQHALQKVHSNPLQCASCVCVVVCACRNTKQRRRKEGAEYAERRTKCTAETHDGNNKKKTAQTHDCTAAQAVAIHTIFI
ncbi:hypothetical protein ECC02_010186 [Trypanosoma cruzi]|uniref:Uncharacterized protein n=1 Tax=Trypanosoma cruzi TaxID=5693 RepID=A0A7J6XRX8_TRYCR|nr:hypothetical protein ECC02_010186 [Trypanosoma cruzi]